MIAIRKSQPTLRRRRFFHGRQIHGAGVKDLTWLSPNGEEMTDREWHDSRLSTIGLILSGDAIEELDPCGQPITGDTLLILLNADPEPTEFTLPAAHNGEPTTWEIMVDTHEPDTASQIRPGRFVTSGTPCQIGSRSLLLARKVSPDEASERAGNGKERDTIH